MFKVFDRLIVEWPVRVDVGDGKGRELAAAILFKFEILPGDELASLLAQGGMPEVLRRAVRGWRAEQIADADGATPLAFSAENLDRLMLIPRMQAAISKAYVDASQGARRGN